MRLRSFRALLLSCAVLCASLGLLTGLCSSAFAQACPQGSYCFYVQPGLPFEGSHSGVASRSFDIVLSSPVRAVAARYAIAGGALQPITIAPGASQRIPLSASTGPASAYGVAEQRGVFLIADSPNLTVDHRETFDQEQYSETIKHSAIALGSRFRLAGYSLNLENAPLAGVDSVLIYAPTATTVTLSAPPGVALPFWSGSATATVTIPLSGGQTYAARTVVGADLDGALLTSTAPVAVSTGGRGWSAAGCGDDGMDGLVPTSALGREHVVRLPTGSVANGESRVRVIADTAGTQVRVNGALVATLGAGGVHTFQPTALSYVQTSQPALVWMNGSLNGCELDTVLIPPIAFAPALTDLSLDFNVLASDQTPSAQLAILMVASEVSSIRLDGGVPSFTSSEAVPGRPDLAYVRFNVSPGDHNVRAGADFQAMLASRTRPSGLLAYYNPYRIPGCGDSGVDPGEGCDDGNLNDGDGCTQSCTVEPGYSCSGAPSACATLCGDGSLTPPAETCDDGNRTPGDGCNVTCRREVAVLSPAPGSTLSNARPTLQGTADPGATVTVTGGPVSGSAVANAQGAWTFTPATPLPEGAQQLMVSARDVRGGVSMATLALTIDASTLFTLSDPLPGAVLMSATPTLRGTGEAGAAVSLNLDGVPLGTTTVASDGSWQLTVPSALTSGEHVLTGEAVDPLGNRASLGPVSFTVDAQLMVTIVTPLADTWLSEPLLAVTGSGEVGATVEVDIDGLSVGSAIVDAQGMWSVPVTSSLANGLHAVLARSEDAAGNRAEDGLEIRVDIRTGPLLVIHNLPDGAFTSDPRPVFSGAADPGAHVLVTFDGVTLDTFTATTRGSWTAQLLDALTPGVHTLRAETSDGRGGRVVDEHSFTFGPEVSAISISEPRAGGVVRDATPTISGSASPGASVQVKVDGTDVGETTADAAGAWSLELSTPLADGLHAVRADTSGSGAQTGSAEHGFYVDTGTSVTIRLPAAGSTIGSALPTLVGTGEPGAIVQVSIDGSVLTELDVAIDGSWHFTLTTPLAAGPHTVRAQATDALGNEAETEHGFSFDPARPDSDGDGRPDSDECSADPCPDADGDGLTDPLDADDDGDGLPTAVECSTLRCRDSDRDGRPDYLDADDDGDGRPTQQELGEGRAPRDTDRDGVADHLDVDDDGDGLLTSVECRAEPCPDSDGDSTEDWLDFDDDNDRVSTAHERDDSAQQGNDDFDGDGAVNWLDPDSNDNGVDDGTDGSGDHDADGTPNYLDPDLGASIAPPSAAPEYTLVGGGGCSANQKGGAPLPWQGLIVLLGLSVLRVGRQRARTLSASRPPRRAS